MIRPSRLIGLLLGLTMLASVGDAGSNGINPPRLRETVTLTAACHERSGARQHEVFRARIVAGGASTERLTVRLGAASEEIAIAEIESIALTATAVDPRGFVPATLVRRGDREESAAVQVRVKDAALRLTGFTRSGSAISIELVKCGKIEFASTASDAGARAPATKK